MAEEGFSSSFWLVSVKDYLEWNRKFVGIKRNLAFDSVDRIKMAQGIYLQAHLLLELLEAVILDLQNDVLRELLKVFHRINITIV